MKKYCKKKTTAVLFKCFPIDKNVKKALIMTFNGFDKNIKKKLNK